MIKQSLLIAALAMAPLGSAFADKDAGCGFGSQIWAGKEGTAPKVLAATTNASFGNQTFGISSGTLGCSPNGVVTASNRLPMFAGANLDQLSVEMAAGQGEALNTLASLYNVQSQDRVAFNSAMQMHYGQVFTSSDVTAADVLSHVEAVMASDQRLAHYIA